MERQPVGIDIVPARPAKSASSGQNRSSSSSSNGNANGDVFSLSRAAEAPKPKSPQPHQSRPATTDSQSAHRTPVPPKTAAGSTANTRKSGPPAKAAAKPGTDASDTADQANAAASASAAQSSDAAADGTSTDPVDQQTGDNQAAAEETLAGTQIASQLKGRTLPHAKAIKTPPAPGDGSKSPGKMTLLQLLAQSLQDSTTPAAAATPDASATAPTAADDTSAPSEPDSMTQAMLAQALAAAFGLSAATPTPPNTTAPTNTPDTTTTAIADATEGAGNSPLKELAALLTQSMAVESKDTKHLDAAQPDPGSAQPASSDSSPAAAPSAGDLAQLGLASHFSLPHARAETNIELHSNVGTKAWHDELGTQLTWMSSQGIESGSLRLSPEHLGPVEVQISVQNGDASVWFGANHPDTRAALEQALPHLREMFASQGLTLTDSGVSREPPRNQTRTSTSQTVGRISSLSADVPDAAAARMSLGLVDTYV
jgi:flagellar hook-length control protein FliK